MNRSRVVILAVAAIAAGAAALIVRGLLGGGTEQGKAALPPPKIVTEEVLVAATNLDSGTSLTPGAVRWQTWPKDAIDSSLITQETLPDLGKYIEGAVVRVPMVAGEPLTNTKVVHADSAGYMAAMLQPGMRAVSIGITTESGAGGFILPNDRVDVLLTQKITDSPPLFSTKTLMSSVRVLAIDQTMSQDKDQKSVPGAKSATLELTPAQAEGVVRAQAAGTLSLSLRPLGDTATTAVTAANTRPDVGEVAVIRYGVSHAGTAGRGE
jgi:pilus assembly protein CpaB